MKPGFYLVIVHLQVCTIFYPSNHLKFRYGLLNMNLAGSCLGLCIIIDPMSIWILRGRLHFSRAERCEVKCGLVGSRVFVNEFKGGGSSWGRVPLVVALVGEDHPIEQKL